MGECAPGVSLAWFGMTHVSLSVNKKVIPEKKIETKSEEAETYGKLVWYWSLSKYSVHQMNVSA